MIEVPEEELEAVRIWNCGMLLKRKQRALLCRSFNKWKEYFLQNVDSKCAQIQTEIDQKNFLVKKLSSTAHAETTQSISQLQATNQQLQRELEALQQEQIEIEKATSKIRDTLKTLQTPSSSFSSSTRMRSSVTTRSMNSYSRQYH